MHWILQNDIFNEVGWKALVDTLERFELPHSIHKVVPFVGELIPPPSLAHDNVICFGSYSMRHVARRMGWRPGVFDIFEQTFEHQLRNWGAHLLNADALVAPFGSARFFADELFVRPVNDSKCFAGRVNGREEFESWQRAVSVLSADDGATLRSETLVLLAPTRVIHSEARFWVVKGRIVTASLYKRGERVTSAGDVAPALFDFVTKRIAQWQPHEAFVIDVCETEEGPKVVEINTLNAAGFYAADVQKLVFALEENFADA